MSERVSLRRRFFDWVPADNRLLYRLCKRYADRYNSENDVNMETNGELRLMRQILPKCHTVFDIGANVGHWATLALQINPSLNLHCFEPSRTTYQQLMGNPFPSNVVCNNFGLSSVPHEANLLVFDDGSGLNSLYRRQGLEEGWGLAPQEREEVVHLETVDIYCSCSKIQAVDFIKVDVEGHELEVFKGMRNMLASEQIGAVQFEYGGCNIDARVLLKDLFDFFKPFAYTFYKIYPHTLQRAYRYDQRHENFQYQNWIVIANTHSFSN